MPATEPGKNAMAEKPRENDCPVPQSLIDYSVACFEKTVAEKRSWRDAAEYNHSCIHALAYLYLSKSSPLKGSNAVASEIAAVYSAMNSAGEPPGNWTAGHLAEARELLGPDLCRDMLPGVDQLLEKSADEFIAHFLGRMQHVTRFLSANLGTSTNHVGFYSASVYRIGMLLSRPDYIAIGRSIWDRLVDEQHPDGYWEETSGGPSPYYTTLTACAVGRMARWTQEEKFRKAALLAARFERRLCYPDSCHNENMDGRVRYRTASEPWGDFNHSATPEGRAFVGRKMRRLFEHLPPHPLGAIVCGRSVATLCENHQFWVDGPIGQAEVDRKNYVEQLQVPGAVRRQGSWFVSMQGIKHFPLKYGFNIDRTSLFSLWHEKTGLIVNGSGELGPNAAQTFRFVDDVNICHIPQSAKVMMGAPGSAEPAAIIAEYAGGTARLEATFVSENELSLRASVGTRSDRYPIEFTLQLELREGQAVNGVRLGKEPLALSGADLKGRIEAGRVTITFPQAGAKFVWPHDPYNPYDAKTYKSSPEKYVSLLHIPIGPEPISVTFRVETER
jgi:hypothetical protein